MTNSQEQVLMSFSNHLKNIGNALEKLRYDSEFTDVTLVCGDGQQLEAHKVILASKSSFFMEILRKNKHPHPLIYMKGIKFDDLNVLVDYMYKGEVSVSAADLDNFLLFAQDLGLEAVENVPGGSVLTDPLNQNNENSCDIKKEPIDQDVISPVGPQVMSEKRKSSKMRRLAWKEQAGQRNSNNLPENSIEQSKYLYSLKTKELDNDIKEMMEFSQNFVIQSKGYEHKREKARICKVCGKEGRLFAIKRHIEAIHISGISHPCDVCGKICLSRDRLRRHKSVHHCK